MVAKREERGAKRGKVARRGTDDVARADPECNARHSITKFARAILRQIASKDAHVDLSSCGPLIWHNAHGQCIGSEFVAHVGKGERDPVIRHTQGHVLYSEHRCRAVDLGRGHKAAWSSGVAKEGRQPVRVPEPLIPRS